jgi:DNA primase
MTDDFSPSGFLRSAVYPKIDAVSSNLFNSLDPKPLTSVGSYPLTCPACKAKEAFYFPGSGYINCPRKNECGKHTSVWDAMIFCGYKNSEIFSTLCGVAGVEPPKRNKSGQQGAPSSNGDLRIGRAIWQITQKLASENPEPLKRFQEDRGYTNDQIGAMRLGYYSTPDEVFSRLKALGFSLDEAVERGYVEKDDKGGLWSNLTGRIIGYWPHPDGDDRLWGRIPVGSGDKNTKKYKFGVSLKKDIPYLFNQRKNTPLVCVEGTMDAWALQLSDIWGCAIGGASINTGQAAFLQNRGISEVTHMVDGDPAGWTGAISSIRTCEALGIVTNIIPLGSGMDDADALFREGKGDLLHHLISKRMNAGRYLAQMLRSYYNVAAPDLQAINRVYANAELLTPTSRIVFEKYAALLGVRVDLRHEAGRVFSALLGAGLTLDDAISNVRRRTGHIITIEKEALDG